MPATVSELQLCGSVRRFGVDDIVISPDHGAVARRSVQVPAGNQLNNVVIGKTAARQ
jgi:hypothetical protein